MMSTAIGWFLAGCALTRSARTIDVEPPRPPDPAAAPAPATPCVPLRSELLTDALNRDIQAGRTAA